MKRRVGWGLMAVLVGALGVVVALRSRPGASKPSGAPAASSRRCGSSDPVLSEGQPIPGECRVEMPAGGGMRTIADLQDARPMVINFWASWCTFCIREMPDFQAVYESMGDRVAFLGLDLLGVEGESRAAAASFARRSGVRYPLAFDSDGLFYSRLSPRLLMPTTVLIRPDGTIAHRQFGPLDAESLRELIGRHLGVPPG
ncbi:MAG: TlpA family protein disulfide reductase [Actinomycetota bacterium]